MRFPIFPLSMLLLSACANRPMPGVDISPASASVGQWVAFFSIDFPDENARLDYFYDAKQVHRDGDRLVSRWKVVGSPKPTLTLYALEIDCAARTFSENGTYVEGLGPARQLPQSERLVNEKIKNGTSADKFRAMFCH